MLESVLFFADTVGFFAMKSQEAANLRSFHFALRLELTPSERPSATAMGWAATRTATAVAITAPMGSVRVRLHPPATIPVPVPPARTAAMGRARSVHAVRSSSAMGRARRPSTLTQVAPVAVNVALILLVPTTALMLLVLVVRV